MPWAASKAEGLLSGWSYGNWRRRWSNVTTVYRVSLQALPTRSLLGAAAPHCSEGPAQSEEASFLQACRNAKLPGAGRLGGGRTHLGDPRPEPVCSGQPWFF